jgi:hypothetical protein
VSVTADVDAMLDAEVLQAEPQHEWVERNQLLTNWIRDNLAAREHRRRSTEVAFVADSRTEIARVAEELQPTERQFMEWLSVHLPADVGAMPCLGLFRELFHDKTVAGVRWEPNDLTDMMYLTAAAGYCDHVVAEREVYGQLSQGVRRLDRTVRVHPKLAHLKREVEARGWSTALSA